MGERVRGRANGYRFQKVMLGMSMETWKAKGRFWRSAAMGLAALTALGVILGAIGPFGSYLSAPFLTRTAYWVVCIWGCGPAFGLSVPILKRWAANRAVPIWLWTPPAIAILNLFPALLSHSLALRLWPEIGQISLLEWYGQCLVISFLSTVAMLWVTRSPKAGPTTPDPASTDPRDRIPTRLGRMVLCLKMEDHYVRVHTPKGSALVLMTLSQAIAGLNDVEGVQTHRSWWVARASITDVIEDGRKLRLRLANGLEAPISRARVGTLRQDGWLGVAPETSTSEAASSKST